jgi:hypothetical protein
MFINLAICKNEHKWHASESELAVARIYYPVCKIEIYLQYLKAVKEAWVKLRGPWGPSTKNAEMVGLKDCQY